MDAMIAKQCRAATAAAQAAAVPALPASRNRKRKAMDDFECEPAGPAAKKHAAASTRPTHQHTAAPRLQALQRPFRNRPVKYPSAMQQATDCRNAPSCKVAACSDLVTPAAPGASTLSAASANCTTLAGDRTGSSRRKLRRKPHAAAACAATAAAAATSSRSTPAAELAPNHEQQKSDRTISDSTAPAPGRTQVLVPNASVPDRAGIPCKAVAGRKRKASTQVDAEEASEHKACGNCGTAETCVWRFFEGVRMCNKCAVYASKHAGAMRPVEEGGLGASESAHDRVKVLS